MNPLPANRRLNSLSPSHLEPRPQEQHSRSKLPPGFFITDHRSLHLVSSRTSFSAGSGRSTLACVDFSPKNNEASFSIPEAPNRIASPKIIAPKEIISGAYYGAQDKAFIKNQMKKKVEKTNDPWPQHNDIFSLSASY